MVFSMQCSTRCRPTSSPLRLVLWWKHADTDRPLARDVCGPVLAFWRRADWGPGRQRYCLPSRRRRLGRPDHRRRRHSCCCCRSHRRRRSRQRGPVRNRCCRDRSRNWDCCSRNWDCCSRNWDCCSLYRCCSCSEVDCRQQPLRWSHLERSADQVAASARGEQTDRIMNSSCTVITSFNLQKK
jgi:hypothetical protein